MSETEELKTRIETIRALSDQLRERNRTVKSLEEEMTATAPEHAWSFGKKHHYNLLKAELEDERRLALEDKYRLGSLSKDLFEEAPAGIRGQIPAGEPLQRPVRRGSGWH